MKKTIFISLYCLLINKSLLFSQYKDTVALNKEHERVNRLVDSMRPILAAQDSIRQAKMEEMSLKISRVLEDSKRKEIEEATKEVVQRQEKEQKSRRNTTLLAGAAFLITISVAGMFFKRKRQKIQ